MSRLELPNYELIARHIILDNFNELGMDIDKPRPNGYRFEGKVTGQFKNQKFMLRFYKKEGILMEEFYTQIKLDYGLSESYSKI
jgi:hypothetical protein